MAARLLVVSVCVVVSPGPRGGGMYVSEFQRARLLDATFAVVAEQGYGG